MKKALIAISLIWGIKNYSFAQADTVSTKKQAPADIAKPCPVDTTCCCCTPDNMSCKGDRDMTNAKEIVLDFKTKNIAFPKDIYKLRRSNAIRIKVVNYNPFLYNVVINSTDSTTYAVADANNLLGWFLNPSNLTSIAANLRSTIPVGVAPVKVKGAMVMDFNNKAVALDSSLALKDSTLYKNLERTQPVIAPKYDTARVQNFLTDQYTIVNNFNSEVSAVENTIQLSFFNWSKFLRLKVRMNVDCKGFYVPTDGDIKNIEDSLESLRHTLHELSARVLESFERYSEKAAETPYAEIIKNIPYSVPDAYIKKFYARAADHLHDIDSILSFKDEQKFINELIPLQGQTSCFISLPIYLIDDIKSVNIDIKPWKDTPIPLQSYSTTFVLPWSQKQIWGVTAGIYFGGLYNDAFVPQQHTPPDTTYSLVKDNSGKIEFGINSLAYTAWKWHASSDQSDYTGIAFGAGLSIASKPKPRILFGWTNVFAGSTNRIMVTTGIIGGPVERLSNAYDITQSYNSKPDSVVKDVFNISGFISINYSFLNK